MFNNKKYKAKDILFRYGFYLLFVLLFLFFSFATSGNFSRLINIRNIIVQAMPMAILCTGLTMVMIMGGIDISVGSVAFVSASTSVVLIYNGIMGIMPAFLIGLLAGTFVGLVNGIAITRLRVNPLITTLAMMFMMRGVGQYLINNSQLMIHDKAIHNFGAGMIGPIPSAIFWGAVILGGGQVLLSKTAFGRYIFAIGSNEKGASVSVINVKLIKLIAYIISALIAAIGGLMLFSRSGAVAPGLGLGAEFTAVTIVVLGGTSMAGGEGSIIPATLFGALMLTMVENGLVLLGANPYLYPVVRGGVMLLAMYADAVRTKQRAFQGRRIIADEEIVQKTESCAY